MMLASKIGQTACQWNVPTGSILFAYTYDIQDTLNLGGKGRPVLNYFNQFRAPVCPTQ